MGRRLRGRIRLLRGQMLEVGVEGDDCWSEKVGIGRCSRGLVVAGMERRLGVSGRWMLDSLVAGSWNPLSFDEVVGWK